MHLNDHIIRENRLFNYGGSETKRQIFLDDGFKYLVKFPDHPREEKKKDILSYVNNSFSEYIGCKIAESIGLPVQKVVLADYTGEDGKNRIVCVCRDLCNPGERLSEIDMQNLGSLDTEDEVSFNMAESVFKRLAGYGMNYQELSDFYYDMFIFDALIGNTDRHNGNWGIIANEETEQNMRISPIYDCGSGFSPLLSDEEMSGEKGKKTAYNDALSKHSALIDTDGNRISYHEYILSGKNEKINESLKRMIPRINMNKIHDIIADIPYASDSRKEYYKNFVDANFEQTLVKGLQNVLTKNTTSIEVNADENNYYEFYKANILPIKRVEEYKKTQMDICGQECSIYRIGSNAFLLDENANAFACISLQSKNSRILETISNLEGHGIDTQIVIEPPFEYGDD